jgi:tetratricopeptide (TPR) repeat protein
MDIYSRLKEKVRSCRNPNRQGGYRMRTLNLSRNQIAYIIVVLSLVGIITTCGLGKNDDKRFANNFNLFTQAESKMNTGSFQDAEPILSSLLAQYPENPTLLVDYGNCLAALGNYDFSLTTLDKARGQRPFLVNDPYFLDRYGQNLYSLKQYSSAQKYLLRAKQFSTSSEFTAKIDGLLADIVMKLK